MSTIKPLHNFVFIDFNEFKKETSDGGIVIAKNNEIKPVVARVIAAGPGTYLPNGKFIETTVKEGDVVIVQPASAFEVEVEGQVRTVITANNIIGKING